MNNEQAIASVKCYKALGWDSNQKILKEDKIVNIFTLLGFKPEIAVGGGRKATPYEILGVPPQLDENNNERPIVFAIKNRATKIGKYTGVDTEFVYSSKRVKEEDSLLEKLKKGYKQALLSGNQAEAEKYLELIDNLTGGRVEEFLEGFYDYTKFYRRMKKQLLIDIFSHFFLLYMIEKKNNPTVKEGIVNKNRIFRAYKESVEEQNQYSDELNQILAEHKIPDFPVITKVQVEDESNLDIQQDYSKHSEFSFEKSKVAEPVEVSLPPEPAVVVQPEIFEPEPQDEIVEELEETNSLENFQYPQNLDDFFANMNNYIVADEINDQENNNLVDEISFSKEENLNFEDNNKVIEDVENLEKNEKEQLLEKEMNDIKNPNNNEENQEYDFQA